MSPDTFSTHAVAAASANKHGSHEAVSAGVVPCYPTLQMQGMRDAKDLHVDLKRTASLEHMHQQQVEAEEQQTEAEEHLSIAEAPSASLRANLSSAVKQHLNFGKQNGKGEKQS